MKKYILIALLFAACSKPSSTPTPSNPNPPASYNRIPLPMWDIDTFVCIDTPGGINSSKHRVDSFYAYTQSGQSFISYHGVSYSIWIDTTGNPYKPYEYMYYNFGISKTMTDTTIWAGTPFYTYTPPNCISGGDTIKNRQRLLSISGFVTNGVIINPKALATTWFGR